MNLAELALRRPVTTAMFFVSLMVIGAIAAIRLPLEYFPAVEAPVVFVNIPYPGSTPAEIERTITRPVEESLSTLTGVERMLSTSRADSAQIIMFFDWSADVSIKASDVRSKIDAIRSDLPDDLQRYQVQKFASSDLPILAVRLASASDLGRSYDLIDRKIKRPLERLPGVASVEINGLAPPELEIELDADRVTAHRINLNELARMLEQLNFSVSAGQINDGGRRFRVQPIGEFKSVEEMRNLVITPEGIRLSDIANISLQPGEVRVRRRLDFKPAVGIDVYKERNANLVDVGRRAYAEFERIKNDPALGGIDIYVLDHQAEGVISSLMGLAEAGFIGTVLSMIVLFFFLRHWTSTLMISMAVPVCFVITLGFMYFLGVSLNVLSMMGLLLGVGMVVDNAVVAVESIYQEREKFPGQPARASIVGVRNVAIALSAGTICHCIVFLPNIFGEENQVSIFLYHVAITITISLLASWLVAVTLTPLLSARVQAPVYVHRESFVTRLRDRYAGFLGWSLRNRKKTLLATAVLLVLSAVPMTQIKYDMLDSAGTRRLDMQFVLNGVYTLDELQRAATPLEKWLYEHKAELEIESVYLWMNENAGGGFRLMLTEDDVTLSTAEIMEAIRVRLPKMAIGTITFGEQNRGGGGEGLRVTLVGDSSEELRRIANESVLPVLRRIEGLRDVRGEEGSTTREVAVRVDRERAARYGFTAIDVATYIAIALRGAPLKEFRGADDEVPVWLRFRNSDTATVDSLRDFKLRRPDGQEFSLLSLVDIRVQDSLSSIQRQGRQTAYPIRISLAPGTVPEEVRERVAKALEPIKLAPGYRWSFGGGFEINNEAAKQMGFNTLIALLMIYVVMAAVFESLILPVAILTSIVFSIFGVFWFFWMTGTVFSVMASIGILILMGVVVNNGIVMVEHINQLRQAGMGRAQALVQGSRDRLRPVLMTMGCTILGMTPLCLGSTQIGGDGPPYYPMARAIVGGLIFSTVVTLLVLPSIYSVLDDWSLGASRLWRRARGLPERLDENTPAVEPAQAQV